MNKKDLAGKTFDQQLEFAGDEVVSADISPNRRIAGEIVFEPLGSGVRVTARDDQHRILWGYVASKETLKQIHCLVGIYDTLQKQIADELKKVGRMIPDDQEDPIKVAKKAVSRLAATVNELHASLDVKKVSEATVERAKMIARIAADADRQITLESSSMKGRKSKVEDENKSGL